VGERGKIISAANGAAANGPIGIMADVGGVIDNEGNSRLYFTIGCAIAGFLHCHWIYNYNHLGVTYSILSGLCVW